MAVEQVMDAERDNRDSETTWLWMRRDISKDSPLEITRLEAVEILREFYENAEEEPDDVKIVILVTTKGKTTAEVI